MRGVQADKKVVSESEVLMRGSVSDGKKV